MSYFQTFGGKPVQTANSGYVAVPLPSNATMAWPIQFQNTSLSIANWMDVEPTGNGFTLTLPTALEVSVGMSFIVNNPTAFSFTLNKNDGTLLFSSAAGSIRCFVLIDNTTQGGSWRSASFAAGGAAVTSINMTSSSNNVVIGGVPITAAGTITLALARDLLSLSSFGAAVGIPCHTAADTWALRTVVGTGNQIAVTNPAGTAGNITLSLAANIRGITSLVAGDISISLGSVNIISTVNANEDLELDPNGTGLVKIGGGGLEISPGLSVFFKANNGVNYVQIEAGAQSVNYSLIWPTTAPALGQIPQYVGGNQLQWANIITFPAVTTTNALARYLNNEGSLENSTVLLDNLGNLTQVNSLTTGNITIGGTGFFLPNTIASIDVDGPIILAPNGIGEVLVKSNLVIRSVVVNKQLQLEDISGNYISMKAPALGQIIDYTLPATAPARYQVWAASTNGSPATLVNTYMPSNRNLLINGGLTVWQRATSFTNATFYLNNDGQYTADMWRLRSNGNDIVNVSQIAGPAGLVYGTSSSAMRFTCSTGGAKFGTVQIIPTSASTNLIGNNVVASLIARGVGTVALKFAVVGWTGAADAATPATMIAAWNAAGTPPTLAANWAYQSGTYPVNVTAAFAGYDSTATPIVIGAGVTNLGLFVWCDSTTGVAGNTFDLSCLSLTAGPNFTPFYPDDFLIEERKSKPFFQKDLKYSTAVGTAATFSAKGTIILSTANAAVTIPNSAVTSYVTIPFEVEMYPGTTTTVSTYSYLWTAGNLSSNTQLDLGANSATVWATLTDKKGFSLQNTSGGGINSTGYANVHYTADCGF